MKAKRSGSNCKAKFEKFIFLQNLYIYILNTTHFYFDSV